MNFSELLAKVQKIKLAERRTHAADYLEVVVDRDLLEPLDKVLTGYFGEPFSKGQVPRQAERLADRYGGIRGDQILYFRQDSEHAECAMLWPWGNGARVTVKIIQAPPAPSGGGSLSFLGRLFPGKS